MAQGSAEDGLAGTVAAASYVGDAVEYQIDLGGRFVRAKAPPFDVLPIHAAAEPALGRSRAAA